MTGDTDLSVAFLERYEPEGPWVLAAIDPDTRNIETRGFDDPALVKEWIDHYQGKRNLYFHVNRVSSALSRTTKAKKEDVQQLVALHVDIDPPKSVQGAGLPVWQQAKIKELDNITPKPTIKISSGSGFQLFWLLDNPIYVNGNLEEIENINKGLEQKFGGDHCHNIDRIMRLPGTINIPDKKKKDLGRTEVVADLLDFNELRYSLSVFTDVALTHKPSTTSSPYDPGDKIQEIIRLGHDPNNPNRWEGDRSRAVYAVTVELVRLGWSDQDIINVLTDKANGISAHVLEQSKPQDYALRQVRRARPIAYQRQDDGAQYRAQPGPLGSLDVGEDTDPIPPRGWLMGNLFCRGFISSLLGDGATGKTAFRIACALSLASGKSLLKEHIFQQCNVLFLCFEDSDDELRRRFRAAIMHHKIEPNEVKGRLFRKTISNSEMKLATIQRNGESIPGPLAESIKMEIEEKSIDVVILDPFVKSHGVPENDNNAIDFVVSLLAKLAIENNIAVDVAHHTRKGPSDPGNADSGRGASSLKDAGRLVYTLTTMSREEARLFGISEGDRKLCIRLDSAKVNLAPASSDTKWFKLIGVNINNSTDLYPHGDEIPTVEFWTPPSHWNLINNIKANEILDILDAGLPNNERYRLAGQSTNPAWQVVKDSVPGITDGQAKVVISDWVENGVLREEEYQSSLQRKRRLGIFVNNDKRPDEEPPI